MALSDAASLCRTAVIISQRVRAAAEIVAPLPARVGELAGDDAGTERALVQATAALETAQETSRTLAIVADALRAHNLSHRMARQLRAAAGPAQNEALPSGGRPAVLRGAASSEPGSPRSGRRGRVFRSRSRTPPGEPDSDCSRDSASAVRIQIPFDFDLMIGRGDGGREALELLCSRRRAPPDEADSDCSSGSESAVRIQIPQGFDAMISRGGGGREAFEVVCSRRPAGL